MRAYDYAALIVPTMTSDGLRLPTLAVIALPARRLGWKPNQSLKPLGMLGLATQPTRHGWRAAGVESLAQNVKGRLKIKVSDGLRLHAIGRMRAYDYAALIVPTMTSDGLRLPTLAVIVLPARRLG